MAKNKKQKPYKKVDLIEVYIWGKFVGATALDTKLGFYVFAYDSNFGKSGIELSPLHMPANRQETPFVYSDLPQSTYYRLPAMLADALPDDFGNALIDRYMAAKGIPKSKITPLNRLAYLGNRAMGALEFKPSRGPRTRIPTALEMGDLVSEARKSMSGSIASDDSAKAALRSIIDVGTSAGGARAKAVIAWNPQTQEILSGQLVAPNGFEYWLLKFDGMGRDRDLGPSQNYGRIEYAYYLMAKAAGINMSDSRLFEEKGRAHFMTKRFDREAGHLKHHTQTLCAMDHLDYKKKSTNSYEQLFLVIQKLKLGHGAAVEAFRRMVFNVMARNCDDHTKNFSFLLRRGESWELAPAYDVTFAYSPESEWTHQHLMSVNQKFKDFKLSDFMAVGDRFGVGEAKTIVGQVREAIQNWSSFAKGASLPKAESARISKLLLYKMR